MRPVFVAAGLVEDRVDDLSSGHGAYMGPGPLARQRIGSREVYVVN